MKFRLQCILFLSSPFTYYLFVQLLREIDFLRYKMWELNVSTVITLNCKQAVYLNLWPEIYMQKQNIKESSI